MTRASSVWLPRSMGTASDFMARVHARDDGLELGGILGNRDHLADLGAGGRGIELGTPKGVGDGLLARVVLQRLGLADVEREAVHLVGAEDDEAVHDLAEALEIARGHLDLVRHAVAGDDGRLAFERIVVARIDVRTRTSGCPWRRCRCP